MQRMAACAQTVTTDTEIKTVDGIAVGSPSSKLKSKVPVEFTAERLAPLALAARSAMALALAARAAAACSASNILRIT